MLAGGSLGSLNVTFESVGDDFVSVLFVCTMSHDFLGRTVEIGTLQSDTELGVAGMEMVSWKGT